MNSQPYKRDYIYVLFIYILILQHTLFINNYKSQIELISVSLSITKSLVINKIHQINNALLITLFYLNNKSKQQNNDQCLFMIKNCFHNAKVFYFH